MEHPGTRRNNRTTNSYAVQGNKRSVSAISSILNLNIRIAYIVMIQFRSTYFLFISHFSDLIGTMEKEEDFSDSYIGYLEYLCPRT